MAGLIGSGAGRRDVNHDIPLVPYIDFLLCLIAFLLVTAVWTKLSRIPADAQTSGGETPAQPSKVLHIDAQARVFRLSWRVDNTVVAMSEVPKPAEPQRAQPKFRELERRIVEEWRTNGIHRDASDVRQDRAVLHTQNSAPYAEVVALLDAVRAAKRKVATANSEREMPVFDVSFAME